MKRVITAIVILMLVGCGGSGGGTCDFDLSSFTNGANASSTDSYWSCNSEGFTWAFVFYDDGTGMDNTEGAFTWVESGCATVQIDNAFSSYTISDISGSIASGIATFTQRNNDTGNETNVSCVLLQGTP